MIQIALEALGRFNATACGPPILFALNYIRTHTR